MIPNILQFACMQMLMNAQPILMAAVKFAIILMEATFVHVILGIVWQVIVIDVQVSM